MFYGDILHPPYPLTTQALSKNSTHARPSLSINYQLRAHCCILSRSSTRTRQTVLTYLGRSFLKERKRMRVTSYERPRYNIRSTADTFTKVIVSQLHAALWCFVCDACCSQGGHGELMQSTKRQQGLVCLTLTSTVDTCLSDWAEHRCLSIICTPYTSNISALKCAFASKWCVSTDWTAVDRLIRSGCCGQPARIYLYKRVCLEVKELQLHMSGVRMILWSGGCYARKEWFTGKPWMCNSV